MFARITMAALLLAATTAWATPQSHDANDLWITPGESGWGLNLFHQGDTLFASLFVYGQDGRARWYTASSLVGDDGGPLHDHPNIYTGALFESTGPALGTPFDPSRVTRRQVGMMTVELGTEQLGGSSAPVNNYANVYYSVDGLQVQKKAYPFSFVAMGLTGSYRGYAASPNGYRSEVDMNISLQNGSFSMATTNAGGKSCMYSGPQQANGSLFHVDGSYSCSDGESGRFFMRDVDVTRNGFTAKFVYAGGVPSPTDLAGQRTSSDIRGDGYNTDLWLAPGESGWGLNIVEQGDIQFGTLFVYDAQGQSRWYSASNLAYEQCAPPDAASDCIGRYRGALFESSGPYFGTSFNEAAVQRRQVGTMSIDYFGNDTAYVDFSVDGVTVTRKQLNRFAFRANSLAGAYSGHVLPFAGYDTRGILTGAMDMAITEFGTNNIRITMQSSSATCTLNGTRSQNGRLVMASGDYTCGALLGRMQIMDVYVTWSGFTGWVGLDGYVIGRIEGTRTNAR